MERISLDTLDFDDLAIMPLFQGVAPDEVRALLAWLNSRADSFAEGEAVMHRGEQVSELGLVMDGSITVESTDLWGSRANSALSAELSRMRADGLIDYRLDSFRLLRDPSR